MSRTYATEINKEYFSNYISRIGISREEFSRSIGKGKNYVSNLLNKKGRVGMTFCTMDMIERIYHDIDMDRLVFPCKAQPEQLSIDTAQANDANTDMLRLMVQIAAKLNSIEYNQRVMNEMLNELHEKLK